MISPAHPLSGTTSASGPQRRLGQYELLREIGSGDTGTVWEGRYQDGSRVAVKVLHPQLAQSPELAACFLRSLALADPLHQRDPGFVPVLERSPEGSAVPFVVLELQEGEPLLTRLQRGRLETRALEALFWQAARCLAAAHDAKLVHGDLHGHNILVCPDPKEPGALQARVVDFGVARVAARAQELRRPLSRSSPAREYLAPELLRDATALGPEADVYSLGALLYHAFCGAPPPPPRRREPMPPAVPERLSTLLHRMLGESPGERPGMRQVAEALAPLHFAGFLLLAPVSHDPRSMLYEAQREKDGVRGCLRVFAPPVQEAGRASRSPLAAAQALRLVRSPFVVEIRDAGEYDGRPWVFMEPLGAERLADRTSARRLGNDAFALALNLIDALKAAHHHDVLYLGLHPENVHLARGPKGELQARLLDADTVAMWAQPQAELQRTVEAMEVARPTVPVLYLAPEQYHSGQPIGPATDVYMLGATLFFMITGEAPVSYQNRDAADIANARRRNERPRSLRALAPEAPAQAEELIERMLSARPQDRPSLAEVEHTLLCLQTVVEVRAQGLIGPYQPGEPAGFGGMGVVFRAQRQADGTPWALKVPLPTTPAARVAQEREVMERLRGLGHPGIVGYTGSVPLPDGREVLVLEYLEGELVSRRLQHGPLPVAEALRLALQTAEALLAAHQRGVVHRDLKPANLMLVHSQVRIIDFGIARDALPEGGPQRLTQAGTSLGTGPYMAPEQRRNAADVDGLADVYALGVTLHEMLTAALPPPPPLPAAPIVDADLRDLLDRMLAENKAHRLPMARVVTRLRGEVLRRPPGPWRKRVASLAGAAGLLGLGYWAWPVSWELRTNLPEVRVVDEQTGAELGQAGPEQPWKFRPGDALPGQKGPYALRLEKPGYRSERLRLDPRHSANRSIELRKARWVLSAEPKGAQILFGKQLWDGDTDLLELAARVPPGKRTLKARVWLPGHATQQPELDTTQDLERHFTLLPARLILKTRPPDATVRSGGTELGHTPYEGELRKLAGAKLIVELAGYRTQEVEVPRQTDQDKIEEPNLAKLESASLELTSQPPGADVVQLRERGGKVEIVRILGQTGGRPLRVQVVSEEWPALIEVSKSGFVPERKSIGSGGTLKLKVELRRKSSSDGHEKLPDLRDTVFGRDREGR